MTTRRSARIAQNRDSARQVSSQNRRLRNRQNVASDCDATQSESTLTPAMTDPEFSQESEEATKARPPKRRKTQPSSAKPCKPSPAQSTRHPPLHPLQFPSRHHPQTYHRPLLLSSPTSRAALLTWYTTVASPLRPMPWRKPFLPPSSPSATTTTTTTATAAALAQRAYEVWISEIMLQQTRVRTAAPYWERWMARWPTMADLAGAEVDDVLSVWRGLGYYGRARRAWEAARLVVADGELRGALPGDVERLMRVPGIGRYTAGAIAAIVYGVEAAMVDGNVLRVLSRQMGVFGDVKGDRRVVGMLWEAAEELVKVVARDGGEEGPNERPGLWGQALMELGSTVCTPKPNCGACPITETCRVYAEGLALAEQGAGKGAAAPDIEDLCTICAPMEEAADPEDGISSRTESPSLDDTQEGLSPFFEATRKARFMKPKPDTITDSLKMDSIINHAKKFPLRKPKTKVREEETLVCAIRRADGQYLIHRRPEKGLLAGMWEFPSHTLPESNSSTVKSRRSDAVAYASELTRARLPKGSKSPQLRHLGELGSTPWLFSHLKLTMHVHLFEVDDGAGVIVDSTRRWASMEEIEEESMGTGMRKCLSLVKET